MCRSHHPRRRAGVADSIARLLFPKEDTESTEENRGSQEGRPSVTLRASCGTRRIHSLQDATFSVPRESGPAISASPRVNRNCRVRRKPCPPAHPPSSATLQFRTAPDTSPSPPPCPSLQFCPV